MKRKYFYFFGLLALLVGTAHAQVVQIEKTALNTMLFQNFENGTVLMKNGATETASLNYNTENQSILFKKGEETMTLTGLESVDTVYMQDRKFVPVDNTFYEVAIGGNAKVGLFITYTNKKKPVGASPEHTGTTRETGNKVNNNVANAYVNRPNQLNFAVEVLPHYWLKKGRSFYKANTQNQLINAFPIKEDAAVREYIKTNNIDFKNKADIIKLVGFCNSQVTK
jgi:hypothetical protein